MSLENRIAKLEQLAAQRARQQAERNERCGAIPWRVQDGYIVACVFIPCDRVPTWQEWASLGRMKASCPDVVTCDYADVCKSGEPMLEAVGATCVE